MVDDELFPVRRPSVDRFTAMCSLMRSLPVRKHLQATAEPSDHHNSVVDIDEILLESGPPFVTGGCRYTERVALCVSVRFIPKIALPFGPTFFS